MKAIAVVAELLQKRFDANRSKWLLAAYNNEAFKFEAALNVQHKLAAADVVEFRKTWQQWEAFARAQTPDVQIRYREVDWRDLGLTRIPTHIAVKTLGAAFALMPQGHERAVCFEIAADRLRKVSKWLGASAVESLAREARILFDAPENEFERLLSVVLWLRDHPQANCFIRELPIEGVDTKWLERNRAVVARILSPLLKTAIAAEDIVSRWNLKTPPVLVRVRHARVFVPGVEDEDVVALSIPVLERVRVPVLCVVENLQTGLALDVPKEIPVLCAMGNAVRILADVSAFSDAQILYMGDLDQHGLKILAGFRHAHAHVQSVMMDCETLERYHHLAVADPTERIPMPAEGLTNAELSLFEKLQKDRLRLEQERIPMTALNAEFGRLLSRVNDRKDAL